MPIYSYRCDACKIANVEEFRHVSDMGQTPPCPNCGHPTTRNAFATGVGVRGDYKHPQVSDALGFIAEPEDVEEHRKRFPDIELNMDNGCARPVFRSLNQKRKYLTTVGWVDVKDYR
jgi:putative FmdB family regulatory protein